MSEPDTFEKVIEKMRDASTMRYNEGPLDEVIGKDLAEWTRRLTVLWEKQWESRRDEEESMRSEKIELEAEVSRLRDVMDEVALEIVKRQTERSMTHDDRLIEAGDLSNTLLMESAK